MTQQTMNASMTTTAKSLQILKDIVSVFFGGCCAVAVNVMNLKIILAAAVLAGVVVTFQSSVSISPEIVVVAGLLGVLLQTIFVGCKPLVNFANLCFSLAFCATVLWARFVNKIFATLRAVKDGAFWGYALLLPHFAKRLSILLAAIIRLARFADPLCAASGRVTLIANNTMLGGVRHKRLLGRFIRILT
jgi:hypothetical protein